MVLLLLLFVHLLADYPLQGDFLAKEKGHNIIALVSHAGIWTGCIVVTGHLIGFDVGLMDVVLLFGIHAVADYLKCANRLWYRKLKPLKGGLAVDQLIHVAQISLFIFMNN